MARLFLSLIALAFVAACATRDPVTPAPAPVVITPAPVVTAPPAQVVVPAPTAVRAGFGRVESVSASPQSAAAGGASLRRLGIRMDDGTVQFVDTSAPNISIGDRVELTSDGYIKRS